MEFCELSADGSCSKCGRELCPETKRICWPGAPPSAIAIPVRGESTARPRRVKAGPCPHLLEPTLESVRLFGCGCSSEKKNGILVSVFGCDLHGRCVPFTRGTHLEDESIVRCVVCPDNPANRNEAI